MAGRIGFTTRASCLLAAGATALACGIALGVIDLARAGILAVAVPLLSALVVLRSHLQIANQRRIEPARAVAGQTVVVHLTVVNRSVLPTGPLMLEDELPSQLQGSARFVLDGLAARETRTVSYRMPRLPRGHYRSGPLRVRLTDPFHLVDVRRSFTATEQVLVGPVVERLRAVDPPRSLDVGDDAGSHSVGSHGADDASTREYRTGDDLRKIHWKSSARVGSLMVRQEERPWQGRINVLLDLRAAAHAAGPVGDDGDERGSSSLEWAVSAAATVAAHGIVTGRDVGLISDLGAPARLPVADVGRLRDHLAGVRSLPQRSLEPVGGLLGALARESTTVAVLGELDPVSLRLLADVHPRGGSGAALALLLDTHTWVGGRAESRDASEDSPAGAAARVLRAAGWQTLVVRRGDGVASSLQLLLRPNAAGLLTTGPR